MVIFYKKWKKDNEIQLTKNKMNLNIRKMTNHPPSHGFYQYIYIYIYKILKYIIFVEKRISEQL